jgi:hypothetical protein
MSLKCQNDAFRQCPHPLLRCYRTSSTAVTFRGRVHTLRMHPIFCKRPPLLEPKAIGTAFVFNFLGMQNRLAVITFEGAIYHAYESAEGLSLRASDGATMDKGPVFRFVARHLAALKSGANPSALSSTQARRRPPRAPQSLLRRAVSTSANHRGKDALCCPPDLAPNFVRGTQ